MSAPIPAPDPAPPNPSAPTPPAGAEFDSFAENYDAALNKGISVSGEDKNYFITGRVRHLADCLLHLGTPDLRPVVMDFGCGTGSAFPELRKRLAASRIIGIDVSEAELAIATRNHAQRHDLLATPDTYAPLANVDVVYSNGTFHHIPPPQRPAVVDFIFRSLRPGGIFALWENNPWNPGTRMVMKRIPFDRDAITLTPPESKKLLKARGFIHLRTDFLFYFPRLLAPFRITEPLLRKIPMGAQYQVLVQKPS